MNGPSVPALPYLAPWYRIVQSPGKVVLEHGQRLVCLEGGAADRLVPALLPLLDGMRTVDEIVLLLGEPARPAIEAALAALAAHDVLVEGPPIDDAEPASVAGTAELAASLDPLRRAPAKILAVTRGCTVGLAGDGTAGIETARLLRASGVEVARAGGPSTTVDLTVCAPAPRELSRLREWNEEALAVASPWLQLLPFDGRYAAIGPLYLPGDTAATSASASGGPPTSAPPTSSSSSTRRPPRTPRHRRSPRVAGGLAAQLVLAWLVLGDHYVPAAMYTLELLPTVRLAAHHVHRVPRCPELLGAGRHRRPAAVAQGGPGRPCRVSSEPSRRHRSRTRSRACAPSSLRSPA